MAVPSRRAALRIVAGIMGYLYGTLAVDASGAQKAPIMRLVLDADVIEIVSRGEVQRITASDIMAALRSGK